VVKFKRAPTIQAARQRFEGRLSAILERRPGLLTDGERTILWQILFGHPAGRELSAQAPMLALETEIFRMADRLSCVVNLHGQGGLQ